MLSVEDGYMILMYLCISKQTLPFAASTNETPADYVDFSDSFFF